MHPVAQDMPGKDSQDIRLHCTAVHHLSIMHGDGPHQPLVNELQVVPEYSQTQKRSWSLYTPRPLLPISSGEEKHVLGKNLFL